MCSIDTGDIGMSSTYRLVSCYLIVNTLISLANTEYLFINLNALTRSLSGEGRLAACDKCSVAEQCCRWLLIRLLTESLGFLRLDLCKVCLSLSLLSILAGCKFCLHSSLLSMHLLLSGTSYLICILR